MRILTCGLVAEVMSVLSYVSGELIIYAGDARATYEDAFENTMQ